MAQCADIYEERNKNVGKDVATVLEKVRFTLTNTAQKMKKFGIKNFIFCAVKLYIVRN